MTEDRDFDRIARAWLAHGTNEAPDRAVSAVLQAVETTPQVRPLSRRLPWRYEPVTRLPIAAAVAVTLVIVAGGFFFLRSDGTSNVGGPSPSASASPDPSPTRSGSAPTPEPVAVTPEAAIPVAGPLTMAFDGQALWVLSEDEGTVTRIDPATNEADPGVRLGSQMQGVSANASGVWATGWVDGLVYRVDPTTKEIVATTEVGPSKGVLATDGAVWVANTRAGSVTRVDPATNKTVATVEVGATGAAGPNWLARGFDSIWVGVPNEGTVVRIDPVTNEIQATIPNPGPASPCGRLVAGPDAMWITSCHDGPMANRIDPSTNTANGRIDLGGKALTIEMIDGVPWASIRRDFGQGSGIVRVDAVANEVDRLISPGAAFDGGGDMVVAAGSLWVVDAANDQVLRLPLSAFGS